MANQDTGTEKGKDQQSLTEDAKNYSQNLPPLSTLTDRFGNSFNFGNAGDFWMPPFPIGRDSDYRTHVRNIRNMEIRPDDVIICSFPKTGLHWNDSIVKMLLNKSSEHNADEGKAAVGFLDVRPTSAIDQLPSPRLLWAHIPFRHLPKQIFEKKIKVIFLDRNPKDVLVSWYNHLHSHVHSLSYPGTFEHFFWLYFEVGYYYRNQFDYLLEWQNGIQAYPDLPVHTVVFEEMKLNPVEGVKKLNQFLGTGCNDQLCEDIAIACSFKNLKAYKEATTPAALRAMFKNNALALYRKGEVGDWKNWFTVAMNEYFDKEYAKRMSEYKMQYRYTLP